MKIGILSDIHGNHYALQEVLSDAKKIGVEKLIISGDFVGYYYYPHKILTLLKNWDFVAIRGNHESYLEKAVSDNAFLETITAKYGSGIKEAISHLSADELKFFLKLPLNLDLEIDGVKFKVFHGSPTDENEYIYPDAAMESIQKHFQNLDSDVFIGGHTHYSCNFTFNNKMFINPGSVGQSRTNGGVAFWGIYNTSNHSYSPRITKYDVTDLVKDVDRIDPTNKYLKDILTR